MPPILSALRELPPSVSPSKLAEALGTTARTVRNWVKKGVLPRPLKAGGLTRFDRDAVIEHLGRAQEVAR